MSDRPKRDYWDWWLLVAVFLIMANAAFLAVTRADLREVCRPTSGHSEGR